MPRRYAARVDANQREIVAALQALGCAVFVIGEPVDLLVTWRGRTGAFEVKDGAKAASARKLTQQQLDFQRLQRGYFRVVATVDEAIAAAQDMIR